MPIDYKAQEQFCTYLLRREFDKAQELIDQYKHSDRRASMLQGALELKKGNLEAAQHSLGDALEDFLVTAAGYLVQHGKQKQAEILAQETGIEIKRHEVSDWFNRDSIFTGSHLCSLLGDLCVRLENYSQAIYWYEQAMKAARQLQDGSESTHGGDLASVYVKLGNPEKALEILDQTPPQEGRLYPLNRRQAEIDALRQITAKTEDIKALKRLGTLLKGGVPTPWTARITGQPSKPPITEEEWELESTTYYTEAKAVYDRAVELSGGSADVLLERASLFHVAGNWELARKDLEQILEKEPEHKDALKWFGAWAGLHNDDETAKKYFSKALELYPDDEVIHRLHERWKEAKKNDEQK